MITRDEATAARAVLKAYASQERLRKEQELENSTLLREAAKAQTIATRNMQAVTAFEMRNNGLTYRAIAESLGVSRAVAISRVGIGQRLERWRELYSRA